MASKLAEVIHADDGDTDSATSPSSTSPFCCREDVLPYASRLSAPIALQSLGIWIDPIDSTAEYIKGVDGVKFQHHGVLCKGLQSAVVLIGIFDRITGEPVMGVVYQPFGEKQPRPRASSKGEGGGGNETEADADATPRAEECHIGAGGDSHEVDSVSAASGEKDGVGAEGISAVAAEASTTTTTNSADASNEAAPSCWQERYAWGVCYGNIKVHSSGGVALATASSPHSSFSFHSLRGGNGSKGSQDFSSSSSLLPSSTHLNNHSHHSTPAGEELKVCVCVCVRVCVCAYVCVCVHALVR